MANTAWRCRTDPRNPIGAGDLLDAFDGLATPAKFTP